MSNEVKVAPREQVFNDVKNARLRHIVERDGQGGWKDETLCGYLWDVLKPPPNGEICKECEDVLRQRFSQE